VTTPEHARQKNREWERRLLYWTAGLLAFETLTGLSIYLLPFSVSNQMMVFGHTLAGLALVAPYARYQVRHWLIYRPVRLSHGKLTGYLAMAVTVLLIVSASGGEGTAAAYRAQANDRLTRLRSPFRLGAGGPGRWGTQRGNSPKRTGAGDRSPAPALFPDS
jgi:hypothetical protein